MTDEGAEDQRRKRRAEAHILRKREELRSKPKPLNAQQDFIKLSRGFSKNQLSEPFLVFYKSWKTASDKREEKEAVRAG